MRGVAVSIVVMTACVVPAEAPTMIAPASQQADAFTELEASRTLDGDVVGAPPDTAATMVIVFASWCSHCRDQLDAIAALRTAHPGLRVLGVNYRGHEEYDGLGDSGRVRAYVAARAPWLIVVPAGERLFSALGRPPKVPTLFIYDRAGRLVDTYDRRTRPMPTIGELDAALISLGA